jgi:hypothetical protein
VKLSEIPDNVKRVLLATCWEDIGDDDGKSDLLDELTNEELYFCALYACPEGSITAWMELGRRPDFDCRAADRDRFHHGSPRGDVKIELDEALPALTRGSDIARFPDCHGPLEVNRRLCLSPNDIGNYFDRDYYRREILRARYGDLFEREGHFGWPHPDYETWAKTQDVPGLPPKRRKRDCRRRFRVD